MARGSSKPPVPMSPTGSFLRGHSFDLGAGKQNRENFMRQYGISGTVFSIVSLLAESSATPQWHLYRKQPVDGRRRYAATDKGVDQRVEVIQHPAIKLWNSPNDFHTAFEFREGSGQHAELTGETFWVLDNEIGIPTSMWYVRPDRMDPVPDPGGFLSGWIYTGPNGENVPLKNSEVILEKRADPLDPYRGAGPVASIMPNIQQQRYATEYQRNLFFNGADPGGVITVPNKLNERDFNDLVDRWREGHRGVARAGHVGILENGAVWAPNAHTNKDMEYGQLRLANRDEIREGWRMHKTMMGTSDDVNRANAQTAEEVFVAWQTKPRLNRRRDTLNNKLLVQFGKNQDVEFDYEDPSPENAETAANEMFQKSQSAGFLINECGLDPHDVLETLGLPDMRTVQEALEQATGAVQVPQQAPAAKKPRQQPERPAEPSNGYSGIWSQNTPATKVIAQESKNFPPEAIGWMYHAKWVGPVKIPLDHIDFDADDFDYTVPSKISQFVEMLKDGKKLLPVILVKTPDGKKLDLVDGHHRFLAYQELGKPVRAYVGTVEENSGDWDDMHTYQRHGAGGTDIKNSADMQYLSVLMLHSLNGHSLEGTRA